MNEKDCFNGVRHRRTSVFTKNTNFKVPNLAYLSIDFNAKMEYNSYCDKKVHKGQFI